MVTEYEALRHVQEIGSEVDLVHSDELASKILWALSCANDPNYWVHAFNTKREALTYAKTHKLKIVSQYCAVWNKPCNYHSTSFSKKRTKNGKNKKIYNG
jgi:hypothetical protein